MAQIEHLWLDYGKYANTDLLENLSGVTVAGDCLWTASDERRTIECLGPHRGGYRIRGQVNLDDVFARIPGAATGDEADIESIDFVNGRLWLCGSHCLVRKSSNTTRSEKVDSRIRGRKSRRLLGCVSATARLDQRSPAGEALPFSGAGSLRSALAENPFIAPFMRLPSKENGLDIEGMVLLRDRVFLGLRGPTVDSIALVVEVEISPGLHLRRSKCTTHFLDLEGLGVRDLARWGSELVVLAGPVTSAHGPFHLYRWRPRGQEAIQKPTKFYTWPRSEEHPEGICRLDRDGKVGLLVLYDSPGRAFRIRGSRYRADWITALGPLGGKA